MWRSGKLWIGLRGNRKLHARQSNFRSINLCRTQRTPWGANHRFGLGGQRERRGRCGLSVPSVLRRRGARTMSGLLVALGCGLSADGVAEGVDDDPAGRFVLGDGEFFKPGFSTGEVGVGAWPTDGLLASRCDRQSEPAAPAFGREFASCAGARARRMSPRFRETARKDWRSDSGWPGGRLDACSSYCNAVEKVRHVIALSVSLVLARRTVRTNRRVAGRDPFPESPLRSSRSGTPGDALRAAAFDVTLRAR